MTPVLQIIGSLVFLLLVVMSGYLLIFSLAGFLGKLQKAPATSPITKFVVFIPSYKEDEVILHTAQHALLQEYPSDLYQIVVIADSLLPETVLQLRELPIQVVEVQFTKSTKAKSLNKALATLHDAQFDTAVILDADNLMAPNFLQLLNNEVQQGGKAMQGHRVAKNLDTGFAILDAISEEINNHIFRKGHRVLGLSSALIGSGMAFSYNYFREVMASVNAVGGFDKELELKLLRDKIKISYVEEALVYDEKVQKPEIFGNQRRRWLSAQVHYFKAYFTSGLYHLLIKGNLDYFDKVFQMIQLPRVILSGLVFLSVGLAFINNWLFDISIYPGLTGWASLLVINFLAMLLAVPAKFYNGATLQALIQLPRAFGIFFLTMFRLKGANQKFIHTPHTAISNLHNSRS